VAGAARSPQGEDTGHPRRAQRPLTRLERPTLPGRGAGVKGRRPVAPAPLPRGERGGWRGAAPTAPRLRSGRRRPHKQRHPATGRVAFFRGPAGAVSGVPRPRSGRRRGGSPLEEKGKILILNKNNKLGGCNRKQGFRTTGSSLLPLTSYNRKKKSLHRTVDSE
ncbi:hypothetical protein D4377_23255, partial [Salmonella enterica subsp. enterica]|nr:hypothetical protein [Salmonella enterica subsp. enterica serovar Paratyphi A]